MDDIHDAVLKNTSKKDYFETLYGKVEEHILRGVTVFVGLSINMSVLATTKYYLDVNIPTAYGQLVWRTLNDLCFNRTQILDDMDINRLDKLYEKMVTKYKIRNPGLIRPSDYINNDVLPMKRRLIEEGYTPLNAKSILRQITQAN